MKESVEVLFGKVPEPEDEAANYEAIELIVDALPKAEAEEMSYRRVARIPKDVFRFAEKTAQAV